MKAVAGLLLLFLSLCCVGYGEETSCDARQNNTKCYGRLGGSVVIQLPNHTSRISRFRWFFNSRVILEMSRGKYVVNKLKEGSVISNENITLHNLNWNDAGNYTLELINSEGAITGKWILQLMIQAPVSYVWTTSQCLSQGETKVSCHSLGGDSPFQYSWSLNGVPRDSSENDSSSITLKRGESGFVVCNVNNNVSKASAGQTIYQCAFVDCTLSNGTHISVWLPEGAELTCYGPTTPTTRPTTKPYNNTCNEGALMVRMLFLLAFVLVVAASFVYMHKQMTKYKSLRGRGREIQLEVICAVTVNPEGQQGAAEN